MSAYLAVGLWHHWLIRRDQDFVAGSGPRSAAGWTSWSACSCRSAASPGPRSGTAGRPAKVNREALLAGSSSIFQSLRAGVALAELVDEPQPGWELAGGRLGHAVREHRDAFLDKSTFSMDWYYPVLGGAVRGQAGLEPARRAVGPLRPPGARACCAWTTTRG